MNSEDVEAENNHSPELCGQGSSWVPRVMRSNPFWSVSAAELSVLYGPLFLNPKDGDFRGLPFRGSLQQEICF